ncbi:PQQ-binding-like beta-propeller repeat protein [Natrinema marinum]|uniref:outer membrane protein assembly factor BamB family protein n=1 Tax=Natrinema marinum TaxID=2961598 RepID=UPI0020C8B9E6|nr:PQQ-binding-like beta-propeller repeat protein [Natrinema marinum]
MDSGREQTTDGRYRRDLIATGAVLGSGLAGCLGVLGGKRRSKEPDEDASTDPTERFRETLAASDPYRMHQYGPRHVGDAGGPGPTDAVEAVWTFRNGVPGPAYQIGTPAIVEGTVYVAEGQAVGEERVESVVYALDGATGEVEWEHPYSGTNVVGATLVADGLVVQAIGSSIVALETESGTERWQLVRDFATELAVADGTMYAINTTYADPPTLVAIDLETGRERWTARLSDGEMYIPTPPAVADGTVYQGGIELTALSAADGDVQWTRDLGNTITGPPTIVGDTIYVPVGDGTVAALERDGTPRWRQPIEGRGQGWGLETVTSPAVAGGTIYVTNSGQITALEAETGSERWTAETYGNRPPVIADGVVYVSGLDTVEAYNGSDGGFLWGYQSDATRSSGEKLAPVVGETVFFPSKGLHALHESEASN